MFLFVNCIIKHNKMNTLQLEQEIHDFMNAKAEKGVYESLLQLTLNPIKSPFENVPLDGILP